MSSILLSPCSNKVDRYSNAFGVLEKQFKNTDMEELKLERGIAKGRFTRKCNVLRERLDKDDPATVVKGLYAEVEDAFQALEVKHERYYSRLPSDNQIQQP